MNLAPHIIQFNPYNLTITSALAYMSVISATNVHLKEMNEHLAVICFWLEQHDPDYKQGDLL
ncbi:hypothetical protein [Methanobacterium sp. BAmetb5]|jgi:hypothetical protein|uniref:hypothetical protein n=1 Tax=Methanobacterium sp. BAmetb5 TaxID=2025351 RepID=UPI000E872A88|nr:hypothetical protein [Methanobacterium sp. BAmetb5]AXV40949.1 MAG: hypothetical protein CIT02_11800 [Methanobacterium sp. BAmetb5]